MIRESTLNQGERSSTQRTQRRTIAVAALAVSAGLVVGLLVGLNWPNAPAMTSSESQLAPNETGEVALPDDYLTRYLARHQPRAALPSEATPEDDYLARYLARHQPTATQPSEATPADDYLTRYLARHQEDGDS